jgi:hypothetical protein
MNARYFLRNRGSFNNFCKRTGIGWSRPPDHRSTVEISSERERWQADQGGQRLGGKADWLVGPNARGAGNWQVEPSSSVRSREAVSRDLDHWIRDKQFRSVAQGLTTRWPAPLLFAAAWSPETGQTRPLGVWGLLRLVGTSEEGLTNSVAALRQWNRDRGRENSGGGASGGSR